jgi:hypothetical protein
VRKLGLQVLEIKSPVTRLFARTPNGGRGGPAFFCCARETLLSSTFQAPTAESLASRLLSSRKKPTMLPFLRLQTAAAALVGLMAAGTPVRADELVQNLGPVGPHEPILAWVGGERVVAFCSPDSGSNCDLHVVVWNPTDVNAKSTVSFEAPLNARQVAHIDTAENKSLYLRCGDHAERLAIVDIAEFISVGMTK